MDLWDHTSNCDVFYPRIGTVFYFVTMHMYADIIESSVSTAHLLVLGLLVCSGAFG